MTHKHQVIDTDKLFSIDPFTRAITHESDAKLSLIQFDHNSERYTFELPRCIEEHDMSLCNRTLVHYINASSGKRNSGIYEVDDLRIDTDDEDEWVTFSWLISGNATQISGGLSFVIEFSCIEDEELVYRWSTGIFGGIKVGEGIDNANEVITAYADILEDWRRELIDAGVYAADTAASQAVEKLNATFKRMNGNVTLKSSKWINNEQTITIPGVTADSGLFFTPTTKEDKTLAAEAGIFVTATEGTITFSVDEAPTADINLSYFTIGIEYVSGVV